MVFTHRPQLRDPLPDCQTATFYILIETQGSNSRHDGEKLEVFLEGLLENGIVEDGVVANSETQIRDMWDIREGIPEACSKDGAVYKYDLSLPLPELYSLVNVIKERLRDQGFVSNNL